MTLNRLYNFIAGQIIQSGQVNAEFNQILSAINNYVLEANFTSNTVVSDGNVIAAISALDTQVGELLPAIISKDYSGGVILKKSSINDYTIALEGSATNRIYLLKETDAFVEDATKTLDLALLGTDQFIDIYIEEDTLDVPAISSTKPVKLTGKSSGSLPYQTSASTGQYLVGCAYLKDFGSSVNKIIGIHSLERYYENINYWSLWDDSNAFDHIIAQNYYTYSSKCSYVPVFINSGMTCTAIMEVNSISGSSGERYNYSISIKKNSTEASVYSVREKAIDSIGTLSRKILPVSYHETLTPGIYTFYYGGKLNTGEDSSISNMNIHKVSSTFQVQPVVNNFQVQSL
jgi:hypothetical protein